MDKRPLLLLTVSGRRTGAVHGAGVCFDQSGRYLVVRTGMGGSKRTPQWFLNLQAAGRARIRIREREYEVDAHVAGDAERAQFWGRIATEAPSFARFEVRTGRTLPDRSADDPLHRRLSQMFGRDRLKSQARYALPDESFPLVDPRLTQSTGLPLPYSSVRMRVVNRQSLAVPIGAFGRGRGLPPPQLADRLSAAG